MKRNIILVFLLVSGLFLAACGGPDTFDPPPPDDGSIGLTLTGNVGQKYAGELLEAIVTIQTMEPSGHPIIRTTTISADGSFVMHLPGMIREEHLPDLDSYFFDHYRTVSCPEDPLLRAATFNHFQIIRLNGPYWHGLAGLSLDPIEPEEADPAGSSVERYIRIEYHPEAFSFESTCEIKGYYGDYEHIRDIKIDVDLQQGWNYVQYEHVTNYIWDNEKPDLPGYYREQFTKTVLTDISDWHWIAFGSDF